MDGKKIYTKTDFDNYTAAVKREFEQTLISQRERIEELKTALKTAEDKAAEYESKKELIYRAITAALSKAEDIERVALIKYNQEIAQLKSFHSKWIGYFNKIIERYPLDDDLTAASKVSGKIAEVLDRSGDIDAQYESERARLIQSVHSSESRESGETGESQSAATDDYADRSPAGFSISEALHPKEDLKDIMRELGVIIDE